MSRNFPLLRSTGLVAEGGVNAVSTAVNDHLRWMFRRNHNETDFGIDGHIDVVLPNGSVTGQTLAVQIKSGASYLQSSDSECYRYVGDPKHFNYYANHPAPVLLVLHNPATRQSHWALFNHSQAEMTQTGWTYRIPKANVLDAAAKSQLLEIVGAPKDYLTEARENSHFEESLSPFETLHYAIDRHDVEQLDPSNLRQFFDRLSSSDKLCRKFQGRVEISVAGYESDPRELWEIDKVRQFFVLADPYVAHWFFFLDSHDERFGLKVYFLCMSGAKRAKLKRPVPGKVKAKVDLERLLQVLNTNWPRLNEMTDRLGMNIRRE